MEVGGIPSTEAFLGDRQQTVAANLPGPRVLPLWPSLVDQKPEVHASSLFGLVVIYFDFRSFGVSNGKFSLKYDFHRP